MENQPRDKPINHKPGNKIVTLLREKWPEYVIEILVIILSITISVALDEWKETQRKQETEQIYLRGLGSDIATDIEQLGEVITETQLIVRKTQALLKSDNQSYQQVANRTAFFDDVRFIMKRPRFVAENATFADLTSTGNMQLLTNTALKRALFDYYKDYESTVQVENAELDAVTTVIAPYLINQVPLVGDGVLPGEANAFVNRIEFKNMVFLRDTNRQELLSNYQQLLERAKVIHRLVKKQLTN